MEHYTARKKNKEGLYILMWKEIHCVCKHKYGTMYVVCYILCVIKENYKYKQIKGIRIEFIFNKNVLFILFKICFFLNVILYPLA
jgi:hypothetical protein